MAIEKNVIEQFIDVLKPKEKEVNSTHSAVVSRIDDEGIVWVYVAGSNRETPTASASSEVKSGDVVTVEWRNNRLYIAGNYSNPSAGVIRVGAVETAANTAREAANNAVTDAGRAREAADAAVETAKSVEGIATRAEGYATEAKRSAGIALTNLAQVQSVLEVAEWITTHGTYTKATTFNPNATYYTLTATQVTEPSDTDKDSEGVLIYYELSNDVYVRTTDTEVDTQKTYYTVIGTPVAGARAEDIAQYYTLAVTDAMANYIKSHLALTNDGLYVMADGSEWKVNIADDGVYILDPNNKPANQMTASGNIVGYEDGARLEVTPDSLSAYNNDGMNFFDVNYDGGSIETYLQIPIADKGEKVSVVLPEESYSVTKEFNVGELLPSFSQFSLNNFYLSFGITARVFQTFTLYYDGIDDLEWETISSGSVSIDHRDVDGTKISLSIVQRRLAPGRPENYSFHKNAPNEYRGMVGVRFLKDGETIEAGITMSFSYDGEDTLTYKCDFFGPEGLSVECVTSYFPLLIKGYATTTAPALMFGSNMGDQMGMFTVSMGEGLVSEESNQTAIGKYNDNKSDTLLEIGNGSSDSERSNSHEFTKDGNARLALDTSASSGTDKEIYDALDALGWKDVIV